MSDRLLTSTQLAKRWGWSLKRVRGLVRHHAIPHVVIGDRVFFREALVEQWLREREVAVQAAPPAPAKDRSSVRTIEDELAVFGLSESEAFL